MRLVIEYDIPGSEGGTPDPNMARRLVEAVRSELSGNSVIQDAVRRVEQDTKSSIPLGRRDIRVERSDPTIYGVKE